MTTHGIKLVLGWVLALLVACFVFVKLYEHQPTEHLDNRQRERRRWLMGDLIRRSKGTLKLHDLVDLSIDELESMHREFRRKKVQDAKAYLQSVGVDFKGLLDHDIVEKARKRRLKDEAESKQKPQPLPRFRGKRSAG